MLGAVTFAPGPLRGDIEVPGDKSISHRALIACARMSRGTTIQNLNPGSDVRATLEALAALGVAIERDGRNVLVGSEGLRESTAPLDCMNSGSTARMLLGVCCGANVPARFDGDASLRRRPMEPVAAQLRAFGGKIETTDGHLPMQFLGRSTIQTRNFILLEPSAQVKSALLFAATFAESSISITGDRGSRDHTERLLRYLGAEIAWNRRAIDVTSTRLHSKPLSIAGDFSAASFLITAAVVTEGSRLLIRNSGVNPTRTGLLEALAAMGAQIEALNTRTVCGEPVADIAVTYAPLTGVSVEADLALRAIDEIPLIAIAAAFAKGTTTINGVGSLRQKETDRLAAIERLLGAVGIKAAASDDRLTIEGGQVRKPLETIQTQGDHRIAMAAAALACAAGPLAIDDEDCIAVSYPEFTSALASLRA